MPTLAVIHYGDPIHKGGPSTEFVRKMRAIQGSWFETLDGQRVNADRNSLDQNAPLLVERHAFIGLGGRWKLLKSLQSYAEFNVVLKRLRS